MWKKPFPLAILCEKHKTTDKLPASFRPLFLGAHIQPQQALKHSDFNSKTDTALQRMRGGGWGRGQKQTLRIWFHENWGKCLFYWYLCSREWSLPLHHFKSFIHFSYLELKKLTIMIKDSTHQDDVAILNITCIWSNNLKMYEAKSGRTPRMRR